MHSKLRRELMRKLAMLSLGLLLCAHAAFAQNQTDTTQTEPNADAVASSAVAAPATAPQAEKVKRVSIYVGGGIAFPMSPSGFSDFWGMGFSFGGGLGYAFSPSLAFVGLVDYNNFALDGDAILAASGFGGMGISISGGSASIFSVSGNLKANLIPTPNSLSPYFIGGIGYSTVSTGDFTLSAGGLSITESGFSESHASILFGVGLDIPASEALDIFLEGKYGIVFTEDQTSNYIPLRAGLKVKL
jgi:hypothetical protein